MSIISFLGVSSSSVESSMLLSGMELACSIMTWRVSSTSSSEDAALCRGVVVRMMCDGTVKADDVAARAMDARRALLVMGIVLGRFDRFANGSEAKQCVYQRKICNCTLLLQLTIDA